MMVVYIASEPDDDSDAHIVDSQSMMRMMYIVDQQILVGPPAMPLPSGLNSGRNHGVFYIFMMGILHGRQLSIVSERERERECVCVCVRVCVYTDKSMTPRLLHGIVSLPMGDARVQA